MEGLKRTCVAKALAVFAMASVTTGSFAQTTETTPVIKGVEDFVGLTPDQVKAAAVDAGKFSFEDKTKVVFLYNVKTGKFINVGGYWGTCTDLHEYGKAMWVNVNGDYLRFAVDNVNDTGNWLGYVYGTANERDRDVFVDRGSTLDKASSSNWTIEPISGDTKNTVKISTTITSVSDATYSGQLGKKYYLSANPNYDGTNVSCSAYEKPDEGYDTLRIFTYDQIYEAQKGSVNNMKTALELSFRLKCPSFERNDNDIVNWKTYDFQTQTQDEAEFAKFGLEKVYCNSAKWGENEVYDYDPFPKKDEDPAYSYEFDGTTYTKSDDYRCNLGKYYCSSITGKCGMVYQNIDITLPGTYVIECKGYSNTTKAKLFAGVLDPGKPNYMVSGTMNKTVFNQVSNMSADEQTALHTAEHNMDYAGKAFYDDRKYVNSVVLTVPASAFTTNADGTKSATIRFGVMTGEYTKVETPAADEWTVFDDFRLQYASTQTSQDLILDEMRDNLNYIVNGSDKYENTTLHLNKTLTKNKWNSLVLPVSLTNDQLQSAFGANTRLAKLKTLTPTAIEFESVNLNEKAFTDVVLDANMPYIIFPEKDMEANTTAPYTALLTVNNETEKVVVPAGHYTIAKVTMVDFSNINQTDWTTKLVDAADGSISAYGTFARTFDPDATQDDKDGTWKFSNKKSTIISGRDDLKGCYFFDKGNMYHSTTRPRGLRGFSCWFKPVKNGTTGTPQSVKLTLDGVTQSGTTGIEDILADYEQPVSRFANGVYNLNGQLVKKGNSTAGLPSGMYIVGGKKCIVR